jgi:hypothetical protein
MPTLHKSTFDYLKPTDQQIAQMNALREICAKYAREVDEILTNGPDKTYILRRIRETAMWINVSVTREADGTPRT